MKKLAFIVLFLLSSAIGSAQNSDLGLLGGVAHYNDELRFGFQVNYARQFWERPAGRLYVELPVFVPVSPKGQQNSIRLFVTPGVRYHFNATQRIVLYAAAGGGVAVRPDRSTVSGAFAYGGGLDFRLTRLWSLRSDFRDLVTSPITGFDSRHNPSAMFGIGLHF